MRRKNLVSLAVMGTLVALILVVAVLAANNNTPPASGEEPSAPDGSSEPPVSAGGAAASSSSEPAPAPKPEPPGPYDETGVPLLLNATNFIPDDYTIDHIDVGNGQTMDRRAGEAYLAMKAAAAADGIDLNPVSGYRSHERQTNNYNNALQRNLQKYGNQEEAEAATRRYYAIPGTSEHEAGLAMDIGWVEDSFGTSAAFTWLQENANEYGFIFRYRQETEHITGIAYEPWHYRYIGANHAKALEAEGLTLEEYVEKLEKEQQG